MGTDLVLEGGDLVALGVVQAVDHHVTSRREAGGPADHVDRFRAERRQRIVAVDLARADHPTTRRTEDDGPFVGGLHEDESDPGMGDEAGDELRVPLVDLLARHPPISDGEIDESEVARGQDGGSGLGLMQFSIVVAGRSEPGRRLGAPGLGVVVDVDVAVRATQSRDELGERLAVPVLERRPLRLSVIGQHDDPIRPGRPSDRPLEPGDLAIDVAQHPQGVLAKRSGMVRHLVVAEEVDVDRVAALRHVVQHPFDAHVAADDRGEGPQQRIRPVPAHARLHAALDLVACGPPLANDLDDGRVERAHRIGRSREVLAVARPEPALLPPSRHAHRQHGALGIAGVEVAVARAVVGEQPIAVAVVLFDREGRLRMVRHDQLARRLVDPPERRHLAGRAVQDPALADTGLRGPLGPPGRDPVLAVVEPSPKRRDVARRERHVATPARPDRRSARTRRPERRTRWWTGAAAPGAPCAGRTSCRRRAPARCPAAWRRSSSPRSPAVPRRNRRAGHPAARRGRPR